MHTLEDLRSGKLAGIRRLSLSENLTSFPHEILSLADSLEILDLSNNQLSDLPKEIAQLSKLKILFASNNLFTALPSTIGLCPALEMVGFKSNKIAHVPEASMPIALRWLILTDNEITHLPNSVGERPRLQKLALAGNQLVELPDTFSQLHNLELLRISANQLTAFPEQLLQLPKLAWFAFSGNPFCYHNAISGSVPKVASTSFKLNNVLGQGASGVISHASWLKASDEFPADIAVKVFKGEVTSDGYPEDELSACLQAGSHPNIVETIAQVDEPGFLAAVMKLIPGHYCNLGLPPNFDTCTRDTFPEAFSLSITEIGKIVEQMESVFTHLHDNNVCHGDLYAHNTLVDSEGNIIFGDFGAASTYFMLNNEQKQQIKAIEARALKYFVEDLLSVCAEEDKTSELYSKLHEYGNH